jgi:hypothetical protein
MHDKLELILIIVAHSIECAYYNNPKKKGVSKIRPLHDNSIASYIKDKRN